MLLRNIHSPLTLIRLLIGQVITRPAWLMLLFILLACLVPFAGGMRPIRGDATQLLDPFGFSLITPSRNDFGPYSLLSLIALLLIPALQVYWRRSETDLTISGASGAFKSGILAIASIATYCLFLLLTLPLVVRSTAFPTGTALAFSYLDLLLTASFLAFIVDFMIVMTPWKRMYLIIGVMAAGVGHLFRCMMDAFIIAPETRELIEADWTALTVHAILVVASMTLYALPFPQLKERVPE